MKWYPLTSRHLDYLTEQELGRYMTTGKTPFLWWLRMKKRHNDVARHPRRIVM